MVLMVPVAAARMASCDASAIARFRRLHITGMLINVVQVAVVAWGLIKLFTL